MRLNLIPPKNQSKMTYTWYVGMKKICGNSWVINIQMIT